MNNMIDPASHPNKLRKAGPWDVATTVFAMEDQVDTFFHEKLFSFYGQEVVISVLDLDNHLRGRDRVGHCLAVGGGHQGFPSEQ
jgi:hypothetical protein